MIKIKNVSKSFCLPHERQNTFCEKFLNGFKSVRYEKFKALTDISFSIHKGEWTGVLGRNGAGKSTLLKILSGVYAPDRGTMKIDGKIVPLLELGVGFHPELTVLQNIDFNATLLGLSSKDIATKKSEILDFAELENFKDQKLKNLSSGMVVRLAFSVAIQAKGEIYLLDEVLAVGDSVFQKKCERVFLDLKRQGKTVILVSHNLENIRQYCERVIWLENGKVVQDGPVDNVLKAYEK